MMGDITKLIATEICIHRTEANAWKERIERLIDSEIQSPSLMRTAKARHTIHVEIDKALSALLKRVSWVGETGGTI
jgi:hypothetical protein